jgi:hypothetical protein
LDEIRWLTVPERGFSDLIFGNIWLVAAGTALLVLCLGALVLRRNSGPRARCTWARNPASATEWLCKTCGAEGISLSGKPPATCQRGNRPRPL